MVLLVVVLSGCDKTGTHPYQDISHFSKVFNRPKYYRRYLPSGYEKTDARFPVIYFFHGWGGRYKSDDNARLDYDRMQDLVDKYKVILVMWDGNVDEAEPRPYNIGNHQDVRYNIQMKDYFPELVQHIDSTCRTISDKAHRGIIGFSMGGFMSYFLAGKYPDMIGAAVSMTGSPEFFVGYPHDHTLYPLRYAFNNLREVKLRFHNSTADELTSLNTEVKEGAAWNGGLSFEYWQFEGGHVVDLPGETKVFEKAMGFVTDAFKNPLPAASTWSHYDLYPEFEVHDYKISSNKREPGFIYLTHVNKNGFGISTLKWLPDGPPLDTCEAEITTARLYKKNTNYTVVSLAKRGDIKKSILRSDEAGRLHLKTDKYPTEVGIYLPGDPPELVCADYTLETKKRFLLPGNNKLSLYLFNRGDDLSNKASVSIALTATDSAITITPRTMTTTFSGGRTFSTPPFQIFCVKKPPANGAPPSIKLIARITVDTANVTSELTVPVMYNVPDINDLQIDDGTKVNDSSEVYGKGNGDHVVNPGEQIMIYHEGHRLRLYTDDPFVNSKKERVIDEVLPAKWPDGFTLSSVISIDDRCPDEHVIECLANFESKEFMPINRLVHWGIVRIRVRKI